MSATVGRRRVLLGFGNCGHWISRGSGGPPGMASDGPVHMPGSARRGSPGAIASFAEMAQPRWSQRTEVSPRVGGP